jgi:hypothetical protein
VVAARFRLICQAFPCHLFAIACSKSKRRNGERGGQRLEWQRKGI